MPGTAMWELRSPSNEPARCVYQSSHLIPHLVTVTVGDTEILGEQLATEAEALDEALVPSLMTICFAAATELIYRDPRLAKALS